MAPLQSSGESLDQPDNSPRVKFISESTPRYYEHQLRKRLLFSGLVFFFLIGAVCPLAGYAINYKWPNSAIKYINFPVIFSGTGAIPPASAVNYVPWTIVGFIFNYVIRRRHFAWWAKYNCKFPRSLGGRYVSDLMQLHDFPKMCYLQHWILVWPFRPSSFSSAWNTHRMVILARIPSKRGGVILCLSTTPMARHFH